MHFVFKYSKHFWIHGLNKLNGLNAKINYIPEILLGEISSHNALPFLQNH